MQCQRPHLHFKALRGHPAACVGGHNAGKLPAHPLSLSAQKGLKEEHIYQSTSFDLPPDSAESGKAPLIIFPVWNKTVVQYKSGNAFFILFSSLHTTFFFFLSRYLSCFVVFMNILFVLEDLLQNDNCLASR